MVVMNIQTLIVGVDFTWVRAGKIGAVS